jgi:ERF superfamily
MNTDTMKKVSIIPQDEPTALVPVTPMDMLNRAVQSGADIDMIEKLLNLQERWEASNARKAFDNAMAAAKAEIPTITKNRVVDFTSAKGRTNYRYEDLGEIAKIVDPILAKHGLFYRYRTTSNVNEPVTVTCIVSHRDGHFEENTLCAGRDESGNKNSIQAIGSTSTYLQRMTLKAALGLAVSNDDDAKAAGAADAITLEQVEQLVTLCDEVSADKEAFCRYFKVDSFADIPVKDFPRAVAALNKKRSKG